MSSTLDTTSLPNALKSFNDILLSKNKDNDCDPGVEETLKVLIDSTNIDHLKKITKIKAIATLAFLQDNPLTEAKKTFRNPPVDLDRKELFTVYNRLCPSQCGS